jgi:uncharacterized protein YdaU (DUF1376 family)
MAYLRLLWMYYDSEKPLKPDIKILAFQIGASHEDTELLLESYFVLCENGWHQKRCDKEIEEYRELLNKKSNAGKASAEQRKNRRLTDVEQVLNSSATVEQLTNNHEPITNNHSIEEPPTKQRTKGSRLSTDFELPETWTEFCQTERPDLNPQKVFDSFKDYWVAKAGSQGVKLDWQATWRNWVRNQNIAKPLVNRFDVAHVTVASSSQRDPALVKLDEDSKRTSAPNAENLARIRAILGKTA